MSEVLPVISHNQSVVGLVKAHFRVTQTNTWERGGRNMKLGMRLLCVGLLMMRNLRPLNSIREGAPAVSR